jgi:hypothetical protein
MEPSSPVFVDEERETPIERIDQALFGVHQSIRHLGECWRDDVGYSQTSLEWLDDSIYRLKAIREAIDRGNLVSNDA